MPETYTVVLFAPDGSRHEHSGCTEAVVLDTANASLLSFVFDGKQRTTNLPHIVITHPATQEPA